MMINSANYGHRKNPRISCRSVRGVRREGGRRPPVWIDLVDVHLKLILDRECTQQVLASIQYPSRVGSRPISQLQSDSAISSINHPAWNRCTWLLWLALKADRGDHWQTPPLSSTSSLLSFLIPTCTTRPSPRMCPWRPFLPFLCPSSALPLPPSALLMPQTN